MGVATVVATVSRIGARIGGRDLDRRRGDFGILGDGQAGQRHQADDDDHQREHGGEDRPIDEETSEHERASGGS